jgi:carbamoyl-phosphate synthase large subunit
MNILFLSSGSRNLLLNELQEKNQELTIYCADCDKLAPTLHDRFHSFVIPELTDKAYIESILSICEANQITGVFPLIDPEISVIAENAELFLARKIIPFVSAKETVDLCFNKLEFFNACLKNDIPAIPTYTTMEAKCLLESQVLSFPLFAKPNNGSGSNGIGKVKNYADLEYFCQKSSETIIQEFVEGEEFGADVYFDYLTGEPVSMGIKKKLKMRSGETDKAVTVKNKQIEELVAKIHQRFQFKGPVDIDIFKINNNYFVSEINPRFGGGFPLSLAAGADFTVNILENLKGKASEKNIEFRAGIYMMKYFSMKVWDGHE